MSGVISNNVENVRYADGYAYKRAESVLMRIKAVLKIAKNEPQAAVAFF
jgi:hypothetical protein